MDSSANVILNLFVGILGLIGISGLGRLLIRPLRPLPLHWYTSLAMLAAFAVSSALYSGALPSLLAERPCLDPNEQTCPVSTVRRKCTDFENSLPLDSATSVPGIFQQSSTRITSATLSWLSLPILGFATRRFQIVVHLEPRLPTICIQGGHV